MPPPCPEPPSMTFTLITVEDVVRVQTPPAPPLLEALPPAPPVHERMDPSVVVPPVVPTAELPLEVPPPPPELVITRTHNGDGLDGGV